MGARRRRVGMVLTMIAAFVGVTAARPSDVRACSCAIPDPVSSLLAADTVVRGRTIEYVDVSPSERFIDRRWLFEVVERFRGDTPAVIEVRIEVELGDCADTITFLPAILLLGPPEPDGSYRYPACAWAPAAVDLAPFFDAVWAAESRGPPAVMAAAATRDHSLVLLDQDGAAVGYLPSDGPTLALAMCPGATHLLQVRGDHWSVGASTRLVRWRIAGWQELDSVALVLGVPEAHNAPDIDLTCHAADGTAAYMATGHGQAWVVARGEAAVSTLESDIMAPGPDGTALQLEDVEQAIRSTDPDADRGFPSTVGITMDASGWTVSAVLPDVDAWTLHVAHVAVDGTVSPSPLTRLTFPIWPPVAVALDGTTAASPPDAIPTPLFTSSGRAVDAPAPTLPATTPTATPMSTVIAGTSPPATTQPTPIGVADDDDSSQGWVVGGVLAALLVLAVAATRRRTRMR